MGSPTQPSPRSTYLTGCLALLLTLTLVTYPQDAFEASLYGLELWFHVVLPALLPFFAMADILMGLGVIHFIGVLLEPFMRPLFRIPGTGAFPLAIGLASGYPLGAKVTGRLRRENLCSREEGERLVAFANTADPLFMVGAVAVGMFALPEIGGTLALSHYLAVLAVGFMMRFHGRNSPPSAGGAITGDPEQGSRMTRALAALYAARSRDGRPLGQIFGDSVRDTVSVMLFVGGCIMMFSVFIRVLSVSGIVDTVVGTLAVLLQPLGLDVVLIPALVSGTVEITMGTQAAADAGASLTQRAIVASAIIAWSGMSVHAQVAAMVHGTDIRIAPYLVARFVHAILAAGFTFLLMGPAGPLADTLVRPVTTHLTAMADMGFAARLATSTTLAVWIFVFLLGLGLFAYMMRRLTVLWVRVR